MNPMMAPGGMVISPLPSWGIPWHLQPSNSQQFMMPQASPDPNFLAAHQQAMMFAKQAYQMAVAQQAMAAAGNEWESSTMSSSLGMGGMGGVGSMGGMGMGMGMFGQGQGVYGMGPMGMMGGTGGWMFPPPAARSSFYPGGARSDIGISTGDGGRSNVGWASRSAYGESFGPTADRSSRGFEGTSARPIRQERGDRFSGQPRQPQTATKSQGPQGDGGSSSRSRQRTSSVPHIPRTMSPPSRAGIDRKAPPPSSWKLGQGRGL
jgi:serine/arginine repetitive matrix protein 2